MDTNERDRMLTRSEVVERFGLPKRYLETAAAQGEGPAYVRIGRSVRYRVRDVEHWIESSLVGGPIEGKHRA